MNKRRPTVSVIIPVFNGARFIRQTLESVFAQTTDDYELIVVDDGSTDNTPRIVRDFGPRLHYVQKRNRGVAAAINAGLVLAQGQYVVFLGADDLWDKAALTTMLDFVNVHPDAGVAYAWHRCIDENGCLLPEEGKPTWRGIPLRQLAVNNAIPTLTTLIRRSAINAVGALDVNLRSREDWDLLLRLAQAGLQFQYLPEFLAYYRFHKSNKSSRPNLGEKSQMKVLDKFYGQPDLPPDIAALAPRAYATAYLNTYIAWHQAGQRERAYDRLREAVRAWPELLLEEDTYYRLLCADQPPGYRATCFFRDPAGGRRRVTELLGRLQVDPHVSPRARALAGSRRVRATAHWMLAWFFYLDSDARRSVAHFGEAVRYDAALLTEARSYKRLVRLLLGYRAASKIRGMRDWFRTRGIG